MKKMLTVIAVSFVIGFSACKEDEDPTKNGASSTGTWTAKLNGSAWTSDRMEKRTTLSGVDFLAYGAADESVMIFTFTGDAQIKNNILNDTEGMGITYYGNSSQPSTIEYADEGAFNITKYNADSLVATFTFKTPSREFTEGKVKIKLK